MNSENRHSGKLFIVSGPSGAGKGTICKRLIEESDPGRIELSVSMTTRKARVGEEEGRSYYFVSRERFLQEVKNDGFIEYAEVYENYYGTPKEKVLDKLSQGVDIVLEIDKIGRAHV